MPDFLIVINDAGVIECVSPATAAAFGYGVAELCGRPSQMILDMPDPRLVASSPPAWVSASPHPILQGLHRDGRRFPLRLTQNVAQGGGQTHYVLLLQDANEPVAAEEVFLRHQELYELATWHGRISVWEVDYRTNNFEHTPVLAHTLGLSAAEIPHTVTAWKQHFHPDDWKLLEEQSERLVRGEIPEINAEMRMLHVDGSIRWGLVRGKAIFDDQSRPVKAIGTTIDITERKQIEEERDRFFTMSLDILCILDTQGYIKRINPAATRIFGITNQEFLDSARFEFVHPDDIEATKAAMAQAVQGLDVVWFENRCRHKDGSYRWLSWKCPAVAPGSDLLYAVARDVTAAKEAEVKLHRAMQDAENANRAKSEFLSRMSHELRTPLNAILGFGQLLQRETLTARQRQQIDLIVKGGRHLLSLINEVLDITRIEVGALDLSPEPIDLPDLLDEIVSLTQPMAEQRGVQVKIDQASVQLNCAQADKQRLKQVLLNLVSNAIKYNIIGGRVTIRCEPAPLDRLCIQVEDTGLGIAADKQARLFTPFDRLGAEQTAIEGSGLGLVLSRRLVEIMGGTLTFTSKPDLGTTFTVELAQCKGVKEMLERLQPLPLPTTVETGPARTLLYIEDNLANVQLVEAVLTYRPGIRLVTAMQGGMGLELARQHRPDLILLDVHLPDVKGEDLMAELRADAQLKDVPVVVISADATKHQIERLADAGAKEYLTKPIDVEQFLRVVDRYLDEM